MNVLIAGCGYVGGRLGRELVAEGHTVFGVRRDASRVPEGVTAIGADFGERASLAVLPRAVDALVYAVSAGERTEEAYERAYVRGFENVLDALAGVGLARVILVSSIAVYGQDGGEWVDEDAVTQPRGFAGRLLLEAERICLSTGCGTNVRLAGIYGPTRTWLIRRVARGEPPSLQYGNRIHRDDCAGAIAHVLELPSPATTYLGVDDAPAPLVEVHRFIAERLGVEVGAPTVERAAGRGTNKRCRNTRLKASGYALRVPTYREGYPPIIDAYSEMR